MLKKVLQKSIICLMVPFLMCISVYTPTVEAAVDTTKIDASEYAKVGITKVDKLNVRQSANTSSKIVGKLTKGNAVVIKSKSGNWAKVTSGNVTGYVCTDYLAIGKAGYSYYDKYATDYVKVTTATLRVRKSNNTNSSILTTVKRGQSFKVLSTKKDWAKITANGKTGWVSMDYVKVTYKFSYATKVGTSTSTPTKKPTATPTPTKKPTATPTPTKKPSSSTTNSSATGSKVAAYAKRFVGNPYVYGGTSLTNGADCSGFVQSVYKNFGISIPRTSRSQSTYGKKVSTSSLQPGDIIFYANNGTVNHCGIYIGGGQIVHASSPSTGIRISNYKYRSVYTVRRVL
ncbi:MAG: NlpC/P60 family protein [bacterium]|nr:NlpC/P60 family protein [bacterium]